MVSELEALEWWQRALKDAQVMGDSVLLYSIDHTDRGTDDYGPRYVPKRAEIGFSRHVAEPLGHDKDCRRLETAVGRVFVRLDESVPVVAAQMRHELEHFLQVEAIGDFGGWYEEIKGRIQSAGLREQEGKLYNLIPAEVDANRAASRFARCWFGEAIPELSQGANGVLFWHSDDPGPLSSLMDRMAEFDDSLDAHIGDRRSAGNQLRTDVDRRESQQGRSFSVPTPIGREKLRDLVISIRRLKFPATVEDYQSVAHQKRAKFVDFAVGPWDQLVTVFDQTGGVGGAGVIELLTVLGERNLEALIVPISKKASELEID